MLKSTQYAVYRIQTTFYKHRTQHSVIGIIIYTNNRLCVKIEQCTLYSLNTEVQCALNAGTAAVQFPAAMFTLCSQYSRHAETQEFWSIEFQLDLIFADNFGHIIELSANVASSGNSRLQPSGFLQDCCTVYTAKRVRRHSKFCSLLKNKLASAKRPLLGTNFDKELPGNFSTEQNLRAIMPVVARYFAQAMIYYYSRLGLATLTSIGAVDNCCKQLFI